MNNPPEPYSAEEHAAWLDSLTPDESAVVHTSAGSRYSLLLIALIKQALLTDGITPAQQLEFLEHLHGQADTFVTPAMIAMVQPMGNTEYAIYKEAASLDDGLDTPAARVAHGGSFRVLTSPRVFWHFCTLNPSILAAVRTRHSEWKS